MLLSGRSLTWFADQRVPGSGVQLAAKLPAGTTTLRLRARDRRGRVGSVARRLTIRSSLLQLTTLKVPEYVPAAARKLNVRVAASRAAIARLGGRSYRIGAAVKTISIAIPRGKARSTLRLRLAIRGLGDRRDAVRRTLALPRI